MIFFSFGYNINIFVVYFFCTFYFFSININSKINFCRVGHIFTENFYVFLNNVNTEILVRTVEFFNSYITIFVPSLINALIGFCHFYYQLGYGLIFYIYFYRRYKAKKTQNWVNFYGNSVLNWTFFNLVTFNNVVINRFFGFFCKTEIKKISIFIKYLSETYLLNSTQYKKIQQQQKSLLLHSFKNAWTPIFKRSSYISFVTFLRRFVKRK